MKVNELNSPRGATHVRVETADGRNSTVEIKSMSDLLKGFEFVKAEWFRMVKNKLVPVATGKLTQEPTPTAGKVVPLPKQEATKPASAPVPGTKPPAATPANTESEMKKKTNAEPKKPAANGESEIVEGKQGHKGPMIDKLLTTSGFKLSTILGRVMKAYPKGDAGRTLTRIREHAEALGKKKTAVAFIDEPDFKAE